MTIPATTLSAWTRQGATQASIEAHSAVRNALDSYDWPSDIKYRVFLQGSYKNHTNIRGDSDVDVVVQCTSVFYSNLSEDQRAALGFSKGKTTFRDFRTHVVAALNAHFRTGVVDASPSKAIKVDRGNGVVPADVVPCTEYRRYSSVAPRAYVSGISFWTQRNSRQVVNFPEQHYSNGARKSEHTSGNYKSAVRIIKNARNYAIERYPEYTNANFASYFIEGLLWNAPDRCFSGTPDQVFRSLHDWMLGVAASPPALYACNGITPLFGESPEEWHPSNCRLLYLALAKLDQNW